MGFERTLRAAQGYLELEMPSEALEEMNSLPPEYLVRPDVLRLRVCIALQASEWNCGLELSRQLCNIDPRGTIGFIHAAYCLHELGRTAEAKQTLLDGPQTLLLEATYYYNMGCYHARLGEIEDAQVYVERAFEMDPAFRENAQHDPDLENLRCFI